MDPAMGVGGMVGVFSVASFDSFPKEGEAPVSSGIVQAGFHRHGDGYLAPKQLGPGRVGLNCHIGKQDTMSLDQQMTPET
jgi:hypothetical protein